ncbi:MAG: multidrug resistance efflux transporter family protein [Alicyclobacillus sp.]|nr:multidrug resistance efflux transporter family protein [Alicyclobacillus sp.]
MRAIVIGLVSSLFFAVTFVFNERMSLAGGSWMWSASLRYLFMFPILLAIVASRGTLRRVFQVMRASPWRWWLWSTVGFGLFYIPLCIAAQFAPAWLVAASWQFTIIAGSLLTPWLPQADPGGHPRGSAIPLRSLSMSLVIFAGIVMIEVHHAGGTPARDVMLGSLPVLIAAFAYPLGNRQMMAVCQNQLGALERVFGMTTASLPVWLCLAAVGWRTAGWPSTGQTVQAAVVAVSSGVIATVLFFAATDAARRHNQLLAAVEATQSGEVVFTLLLEMIFVAWRLPSPVSLLGIALVVAGMVGHSMRSRGQSGSSNGVSLS